MVSFTERRAIVRDNRTGMIWNRDIEFWQRGVTPLAGVDEVGRGCLGGPLLACAYIARKNVPLPPVRDSKQLSADQREILYAELLRCAEDFAIGYASAQEVDRINVLEATKLAMTRALRALRVTPRHVLVDGLALPDFPIPNEKVIKGDNTYGCIAAASIIAKVTRDTLMRQAHRTFPNYGFDRNKGYGTAEHMQALRRSGPCLLHRMTFKGVHQPTLAYEEVG